MTQHLTIHYYRFYNDYDGWTLWTWQHDTPGTAQEIAAVRVDAHGAVFHVPLTHHGARVGFLPKFRAWEAKDGPDRFWQPGDAHTLYLMQGDDDLYTAPPPREPWLRTVFADSGTLLHLTFNRAVACAEVTADTLHISQSGQRLNIAAVTPVQPAGAHARSFAAELGAPCDPEELRLGHVRGQWRTTRDVCVLPRYVWDDQRWTCALPLGPYVDAGHFFLRVWAPAAQAVRVVMAATAPLPPAGGLHTPPPDSHPMQYMGRGVWELKLFGDFRNWYYRLESVLVHDPSRVVPVIDPYARAVDRQHRAGVLIDDHTPVAPGPSFPFSHAVIYEAHVRDFTNDASSGAHYPGTYLGFVEPATHLPHQPDISTGFDHLCALGVNTVQLMPVHLIDLDERVSEHAWGYMTLHFNAPETVYATDRHCIAAVRELKQMIDALHRAGFKVTMDVVYNHSTESRTHAVHWNGLAPDYFYRARPDGSYYNGSGCGNEFRSEGAMARVFLLDSLKYWVTAYGIDGFRFDLMGLLDLETMRAIVRELRAVKPDVFVYGEPWAGGDTPIRVTQKGDQRGWSGSAEWFTGAPYEAINYVECHDNRTLRDKLAHVSRAHLPPHNEDDRLAEDRLAAFLVVLAQGVPFLHAGQEFYRTKFGEHNSYNRGDRVNNLCWSLKAEYGALCAYYHGLLALRAAHPLFRNSTQADVEKRVFFGVVKAPYIVCELDGLSLGDTWRRALVLVNPTSAPWSYAVPEAAHAWHVYVAGAHAAAAPLFSLTGDHHLVAVPPRSAFLMAEHMQ